MKRTLLISGAALVAAAASAQDSTRPRAVNVTASFRPQLKEAAKINFNATPPVADTSRPVLQYRIPNQNLLFAFQPGSLKPVALSVDSILKWDNWNYVKAGYGTQQTPYIETGLSIGDASKAGLNVYGNYFQSKGKLAFQEMAHGQFDAVGQLKAGANHEVTARLGFQNDQYYRYGTDSAALAHLTKDSLSLRYTGFRGRIGLRNTNVGAYGISYAPELRFDVFGDNHNGNETATYFNVPLRKTIEGRFEVELALDGGIINYESAAKVKSDNNYFQVSPSLFVKTVSLYLQAGIRPSWDNGTFDLMPNVLAEVGTADKRLSVIAGWTGRVRPNTFQFLAGYNPWIAQPLAINNTRIEEIYGGIKGTVTDHFSYLARGGVNRQVNAPLFVNEGTGNNSFGVIYEPDMRTINVHLEAGYAVGDRFNLRSTLDMNRYTSLETEERAWGLPRLEFNTALRLQVLRDLYVKGDVWAFDGIYWRDQSGNTGRTGAAVDASAGLEFAVYKNIKLWAQFNNLFNTQYQRWNQYKTYGFQFMGGVVFSFAQNKK
ncbi:hypothetical protein EPD60_00555 [Flaviaesturariibacter flavus]|uniref:TonB-dependent receptor n=1 Tax=Flaviaesturariibacter flavus TaxID=2502780 RepID=A0A4R1BQT5_9BACT|nr:hypothetical protein [Flaviaesturariibacter flavus]TCJ19646.1 hypothetical protein EPD60_00555 [Flaviaesturariibacter flavus]